jgi:hypothetical protein
MAVPSVFRKNPDEHVQITCDFTYRLGIGESISSATAALVGSPTGPMTVGGSPSISSPLVTVTVSGGTDKTTNSFEVLATTNSAEVLAAVCDVIIDSRDF